MKGFTLIELLAVIVVLTVLLIISIPVINNVIEDSKKSTFESSSKIFLDGAKNYYVTQMLDGNQSGTVVNFSNGSSDNINYQSNLKKNTSGKLIIYTDGKIEFALYDGKYCSTKNISNDEVIVAEKAAEDCQILLPNISLNGNQTVNIEINGIYTELGATYDTGSFEKIIKKDNNVVTNVDTSTLGTYEITYKITVGEKFNSVTRIVNVIDITSPVLTVPANSTIEVNEVAGLNLMTGVSVTDNSGELITPIVSGNISAIAGVYNITYTATDSSGNSSSHIRTITVNSSGLIDTGSMTAAEMAAAFTGNTNTSRGSNTFIDGGVIQSSASSWDGAFFALNQTIPRSGVLTIEYEVSFNKAHYAGASVGAAVQIANAAGYNPNLTTGYYNAPQVAGILFQSFGAYTTFRWNAVAASDAQSIPAIETFASGHNPTMAINTFYKVKAILNLTTGAFEYYYNDTLIRSGTFSASSMNLIGANAKIIFINGNYTAQVATYKNIKINVE